MPNTYTGWPVIPSGDARLTVIDDNPALRATSSRVGARVGFLLFTTKPLC